MAWLDFPQLILYHAALVGCVTVGWCLVSGRFADPWARWVRWVFPPGALLGGALIAVLTTPDWSPIALLWLFLPFFAFAIWAFYFALLLGRGRDPWTAGRRALTWTYPSLFSAPIGVALAVLLLAAR